MKNESALNRVLVADDSETNRAIIKEILSTDFEVVEASDGKEAIDVLRRPDSNISLVLLDILMPNVDGFGVLEAMKKYGWLDYIPVIVISTESTAQFVDKAYEMGTTDFIAKPYNPGIVRHRVLNNIKLFNRHQFLLEVVADQVYEQHRYADMMINILSSVMEIKNGESGLHILHINAITRILAQNLLLITDKYTYTQSDVQLIAVASSLHDIGKMAVPDEIINKPGKLTPEEFAVMKTHSAEGAKLIAGLVEYKDERLIKYAYDICLYHHERYDGRGYPCGLKGDEIPIWAQIVSVADVFDALISERVYKAAYTPEKALEMITGGECGEFNPLIIECLLKSTKQILATLNRVSSLETWEEKSKAVVDDVVNLHAEGFASKTMKKYNVEMIKHKFLTSLSDGIVFECSISSGELIINANPRFGIGEDVVFDPTDREKASKYFYMPAYERACELIRTATPADPKLFFETERDTGDGITCYSVNMLCIYSEDGKLEQVAGKINVGVREK